VRTMSGAALIVALVATHSCYYAGVVASSAADKRGQLLLLA
jgi:hypothetical protein